MQLKKHYQPRKSHRIVSVNLEGNKIPLYGAGSTITVSQTGSVEVALVLKFEIRSRGDVVGKLVRTRHHKEITCPLVINSAGTKPIKFKKNSCTYEWYDWFVHFVKVHVCWDCNLKLYNLKFEYFWDWGGPFAREVSESFCILLLWVLCK